jgi:hypothetical protein
LRAEGVLHANLLCSLLAATMPFGTVLADAPNEKNAKVTLVRE